MNTTVTTYPQLLQQFRGLPGSYGTIDITAQSADALEFKMTQEWFSLNRDDAQELIRILTAWLAGPPDVQLVRTSGAASTVIMKDEGPGAPKVVLLDNEVVRTAGVDPTTRHYDASRRPT